MPEQKSKIEVGTIIVGIFKSIKTIIVSAVLFAVTVFALLIAVPDRVLNAIEIIKNLLGG